MILLFFNLGSRGQRAELNQRMQNYSGPRLAAEKWISLSAWPGLIIGISTKGGRNGSHGR